ncbi:MAG: sterol desaturase family protein [Pseudomonadota bacterium]
MDLIALAVPFFLLAIGVEWYFDRARGTGFFRMNDAIGSLATGAYNSSTGLFTKLVSITIYAVVLENFAVYQMPLAWFDFSPAGLLAWMGVLLVWDFFYYWKHRLGHEVSVFWAAHSVHHQSEEYNLTTALRQTSTDFLVGWVVYLPMFVLGVPVEVFLTVSAIDLIYQFWVHTRHIDRLGWLDYWLVTPSNHRVHHAQNPRYIDKNYGGILIVWDRLFGTFEPESEPPIFGVRKALQSFNPINANLQVYRSLIADTHATRGLRNKLRIWFGRTGWRSADAEQARPLVFKPLSEFKRFGGVHSSALNAYLGAQLAVAIVLTFLVGIVFEAHGALPALLLAIALWWLLACLGGLADGAAWATPVEWLRLTAAPVVAWIVALAIPAAAVWWVGVTTAYAAVSALLLYLVQSEKPRANQLRSSDI